MFNLDILSLLISWKEMIFQLAIFLIQYPKDGHFRTDSLFALIIGVNEGIYFEFLFIVLIGNKEIE